MASVPCKERILAAVKTALETITVSGLKVERDRDAEILETDCPILVFYEVAETPQDDFTGEDSYTMTVQIEGATVGEDRAAAVQERIILEAEVKRALLSDVTLGGVARNLRRNAESEPPRLDWAMPETAVAFNLPFDIDYATVEGDPFTFA